MGQRNRPETSPDLGSSTAQIHFDHFHDCDRDPDQDLDWPFGGIDTLNRDDIRNTAYEIFFTACRSSPGFSGGNRITLPSHHSTTTSSSDGCGGDGGGGGGASRTNGVGMVTVSKVKRALGLKTQKRITSRRTVSAGAGGMSPSRSGGGQSPGLGFMVPAQGGRIRRPMTSAEIMRQQMRVSEQSDNRLRKTLMRTLVGQVGRRAETIILPLELLRHLKPSEFSDAKEYQVWQKRQLKVLEAGLLLHPSVSPSPSNAFATRLRDIVRGAESRPIDTGKNSETMRSLCNSVVSLSWRITPSNGNVPPDVCHWADGHPLNLHLYVSLLRSIFDLRDETHVLDEVDELLELIKKTWSTLAITRPIHNICFMYVLFEQYVLTGQAEPDLLCATLAVMNDVGADSRRSDREPRFARLLVSVLASIRQWAEGRLLHYHHGFHKGTARLMESLLPLVLTATNIMEKDLAGITPAAALDSFDNPVDHYIRSSMKSAFAKLLELRNGMAQLTVQMEVDVGKTLLYLAKETEELAAKEKEWFSPVLKRWHPVAAGVAAVTLHNCYGLVLRQYLGGISTLTNEAITVLQRAGQLEKFLVQMAMEEGDGEDDDGGKTAVVRDMVPYEVGSIILRLLRSWTEDKLKGGKDCIQRAKETETWSARSKMEPYAQSAIELVNVTKQIVGDFFEIPVGISEDLVQDLADGLEALFREYTGFAGSCGSKQSYIPTLPPLTRCNRGSKLRKFWRKATPCNISVEDARIIKSSGDGAATSASNEGHSPRPSTRRGTRRLYIRLNSLHYLLSHLHALDKTLSLYPRAPPSTCTRFTGGRRHHHPVGARGGGSAASYFDLALSSIQSACEHVSQIAAFRLIFLDSSTVLYDGLYVKTVANARIRPALRTTKQNLSLLCSVLTDQAQALAVREVMKASFEAFLMALLAGGSSRAYSRTDHGMLAEDLDSLKRVFCSCGEGLIPEDVIEREAATAEGVVGLMGQSTELLIEDFSIAACEASGMGVVARKGGVGGHGHGHGHCQRLPMPPTSGRWSRYDPNTILRVLCHRNDQVANHFLKRTFQLAKRK